MKMEGSTLCGTTTRGRARSKSRVPDKSFQPGRSQFRYRTYTTVVGGVRTPTIWSIVATLSVTAWLDWIFLLQRSTLCWSRPTICSCEYLVFTVSANIRRIMRILLVQSGNRRLKVLRLKFSRMDSCSTNHPRWPKNNLFRCANTWKWDICYLVFARIPNSWPNWRPARAIQLSYRGRENRFVLSVNLTS